MPAPGSIFIAITGGSGAGKSWLVARLQQDLAPLASALCLDRFYLDLSAWPHERRARFNFDDPAALDWPLAARVLDQLGRGLPARLPVYDFATHTRLPETVLMTPAPIVLIDGLWLPPESAGIAAPALAVFVDCPAQTRLDRRLQRDTRDRGRSAESVLHQWRETVAPMYELHIQPQRAKAGLVIPSPAAEESLIALAGRIRRLLDGPAPSSPP